MQNIPNLSNKIELKHLNHSQVRGVSRVLFRFFFVIHGALNFILYGTKSYLNAPRKN